MFRYADYDKYAKHLIKCLSPVILNTQMFRSNFIAFMITKNPQTFKSAHTQKH